MPLLQIIIASTRPGRIGLPVAQWFEAAARSQGSFDVEVADLAEIALPFFDEPKHPSTGIYEHQHTKDWSARIGASDAFAVVMPEYNNGMVAPLKNALDFLNAEWRDKAMGIISYGGVSAGLRAAQQLKEVAPTLGLHIPGVAVSIPFVQQFLGEDGTITPNDTMAVAATSLLDELARLDTALRTLRV